MWFKNILKMKKWSIKSIISDLSVQILIAMIAGVVVGRMMGAEAVMFAPLGTLFIQLIRMLVVPLVFVSIVSGSASLGATRSAGIVGLKTLSYIFISTILAVILAMVLSAWFKPGAGISVDTVRSFLPETGYSAEPQKMEFWPMIFELIPVNPIKSLTDGNILQIIFFGLFFGFGISALPEDKKNPLLRGLNTVLDALIWCIGKVMWVAPIGVFGLMADATGTFGFSMLWSVGKLFWVNVIAALFILLVFYPLTIKLFSKIGVIHFFKSMIRAQLVALSTSSSLATLPVTLKTTEEKLGVSKQTAGFVVPLGATINMTGNAIYYTLVALFFAQLYGIELSIAQYLAILITTTVGSVGQAGVPGPTLLVVAVLVSAGIPIEGLPLLYALDRIFDMLRTVLNITGDAACAVVVDSRKNML